jgi:hypothetical protein
MVIENQYFKVLYIGTKMMLSNVLLRAADGDFFAKKEQKEIHKANCDLIIS